MVSVFIQVVEGALRKRKARGEGTQQQEEEEKKDEQDNQRIAFPIKRRKKE